MKTKKATPEQLRRALNAVNKRYADNIRFNRFEPDGATVYFTLRVISSKGPGAHIATSGRRTASACWHVHGHFFEALFSINPGAIIVSLGGRITAKDGNWVDRNVGSNMRPAFMSELCECGKYIK